MRSEAGLSLRLAAWAGLLFLHLPMAFILLYAFTTEDKSYQFPPPGLTWRWFAVAWERQDIWRALGLSVKVGLQATALAMILGTLAAAALWRSRFFGRDAVNLLLILPRPCTTSSSPTRLHISYSISGLSFASNRMFTCLFFVTTIGRAQTTSRNSSTLAPPACGSTSSMAARAISRYATPGITFCILSPSTRMQ